MPDVNSLDSNKTDKNVSLLKFAISAILPCGAGNILSEIIGSIIPNQQMDRVIEVIKELNSIVDRQFDILHRQNL